jgi:hypothetical protein
MVITNLEGGGRRRLEDNDLTGTMPTELARLTRMQEL